MTTWIFLRGLTREARHWGDFPQRFQAALPEAVILTPDLPGNGSRYRETSPWRIETSMEAVRADLARQGHRPPYRLLALSLGGMVALAWATRHPQEIEAAVLLSTSLRPHNPLLHRLRPAAWPVLLQLLTAPLETRERAILELTSQRPREMAGLVPDWVDWARQCPVTRRNALRQLLAAARFRLRQKPSVPLLLLAGVEDRMVSPQCTRALAATWNLAPILHPTAGHDLTLDAPEWVVDQVLARGLG